MKYVVALLPKWVTSPKEYIRSYVNWSSTNVCPFLDRPRFLRVLTTNWLDGNGPGLYSVTDFRLCTVYYNKAAAQAERDKAIEESGDKWAVYQIDDELKYPETPQRLKRKRTRGVKKNVD